MRKEYLKATKLIAILSILFLIVAGTGLYFGCNYIDNNLLKSNQAIATDLALLVKNNFYITDAEVAHMKSLTFNEMEVDPVNNRLMDIGNGVVLHAAISNVYVIVPLADDEYRYCPNKEVAEFLGVEMDTPLNGLWLLNGRINKDGVFEVAKRDDIYRYTVLDETQSWGMKHIEAISEYSSDAWGNFITGYAPIFTVEGSFVGLLGIDMNPDSYQSSAKSMISLIIALFSVITITIVVFFILFYVKYSKMRESQRKLEFFSNMSHEMRTPMNGILGMAELSKDENNIDVLHHNFALVEASGKHILGLINNVLDYKKDNTNDLLKDNHTSDNNEIDVDSIDISNQIEVTSTQLQDKRILLCEDHPLNAAITRKVIEKAGGVIDSAENGKIGLEKFMNEPAGYYDVILMDIHMPVMDGIEATRRIRTLSRRDAKTIPIIALTANSYPEDIQNTKDAGMNAHLTKPVQPALLYQTIINNLT